MLQWRKKRIIFVLEKFHRYTFGGFTKIISDHKSLQVIMKNSLDRAPRTLQGMLLKTSMLSFVPIRPTRLQKIQRSTFDDEVINLLIEKRILRASYYHAIIIEMSFLYSMD